MCAVNSHGRARMRRGALSSVRVMSVRACLWLCGDKSKSYAGQFVHCFSVYELDYGTF